jgi:starch synthase
MDLWKMLYMPFSHSLEFDNCINFMKTAIMESNVVTTVSPSYKDEILTEQYSYRLNNILGLRYFDLYGIINGIDTVKYDPLKDLTIYKNYDIDTVKIGKRINKVKLLEQFGLENPDAPLFGLVSRLVDQKGIDLIFPIIHDVIQYSNANFIMMGSGDAFYEDMFRQLEAAYPNRFKCYIGYSDPIAQKIYAGSDIFLMPSKFEPCGLGQMIAMRYGTLPLVRETGGLKDSVIPYNQYTGEGTGFSFTNYNAHDMMHVLRYAETVYYDKKREWNKMVERAMTADFSWSNSAKKYEALYKSII